jgi:hypothetical protein
MDPVRLVQRVRRIVEESIVGSDVDPRRATFLVFRADTAGDAPAQSPVCPGQYASAACLLPGDAPRLYFEIVDGVPEDVCDRAWLVSPDVRTPAGVETVHVAMQPQSTFADLVDALHERGALPRDRPARATVATTWFVSVLTPETILEQWLRPRVEVVPDDQRELPPGARAVCTVLGDVDTSEYFRPIGWPAFVIVREGQAVADWRADVARALAIPEADVKGTRLFVGERYVQCSPGYALRDDADLSAIPDAAVVFALAGGKRRPRRSEQGIRFNN